MRETPIENQVSRMPLERLVAHPDSPNRMSKRSFAKLVRNIEKTGRYEPLVVRPCPRQKDIYQLINGHHRCRALRELGYEMADVIIWDVDDHDTDLLLGTINRLGGSDVLDRKLALLSRLRRRVQAHDLAKLLPQSQSQIERLTEISADGLPRVKSAKSDFAIPLVFFVSDEQQKIIERALSIAKASPGRKTKAARNAAALASIAERFNMKS
ncbi:MAG: ParB/RepB/Spo0J family partition protein [Planctomycetota bacterium]|jgi:ParB/RepB/Spo0J family partition protein